MIARDGAALNVMRLILSPVRFAVLMVAFAFRYRHRAFDKLEIFGIAIANFCIGAFLFFPTPIGLVSIAIGGALIARRMLQEDAQTRASAVACA